MTPTILATHSGSFHADDVFAYAILVLAIRGGTKLVRTRNLEELAKADIVFDVGGGKYDHHMSIADGKPFRDMEKTLPYSSAGLVWRDYGRQAIINHVGEDIHTDAIWEAIDKSVILQIDLNDNGVRNTESGATSIIHMVSVMNPSWDETTDTDERFWQAKDFVFLFLMRQIKSLHAAMKAEQIVLEAYKNSPDPRYLILDQWYPWRTAVEKNNLPVIYLVYDGKTQWRIEAMHEGDLFVSRKKLPEAWCGKSDQELQQITGVPDATFCHPAGFTCGAKSARSIMTMLKMALGD